MDTPTQNRIAQLHPSVRAEVTQIIQACDQALTGRAKVRITQGLRTFKEQDDLFGHMYTKQEKFVWDWFEDLNELKFRPMKTITLPSWGGAKEHQVYELINTHKSKFD